MAQIDHNPYEKRPTNRIWWAAWTMVAIGWALNLYSEPISWRWVALGAVTGMILASWAIEITGNKVPESWTNAARRGRTTGVKK